MKYIMTILCIIGAISIATVWIIWPEKGPDDKDVVMIVNKHKFTNNMISDSQRQQSSYHESRNEFLNSVAIEQVLLQEAQSQKIDSEPAFRDAIKNYYEQSLIKILLDRQNQEINDTVTEEEIDEFLSYFGKTITFSRAQGEGNATTPEVDWNNSETTTELFDNLSSTLQPVLAGLTPGNTREVFDTGNEWFGVRVEKITGSTNTNAAVMPREMIRSTIAAHKRQQLLNTWINRLVANAEISIKKESK